MCSSWQGRKSDMTTTTELPNPNLEQKIDILIQLVNDFRYTLLERMDKVEADSRERYVDLRQRIEKLDSRLTTMERRLAEMDERMARIEHDVAFLMRQYHHIDRNIFVTEFNLLKDRRREAEDTRALRN
jgi:predicted  nucleic acid-binding Zn-ribbon protein